MPLIPRQLALQVMATGSLLEVLDVVLMCCMRAGLHTSYLLPAGQIPQHVALQLWDGSPYPPPGNGTVSSVQALQGTLQRSQESTHAQQHK